MLLSRNMSDARVFDAMWNAGTYCPYNASIGEDARKGWEENKDKIPKDVRKALGLTK